MSKYSPYDTTIVSQVTSFGVHAKIGHYNTVVWVTDLATGNSVPDASVELVTSGCNDSVYNPGLIHAAKAMARGSTGTDGIAVLKGTEELDPKLDHFDNYYTKGCFFVRVVKGEQMALLPIDYKYNISGSQASASQSGNLRRIHGHIKAWGLRHRRVFTRPATRCSINSMFERRRTGHSSRRQDRVTPWKSMIPRATLPTRTRKYPLTNRRLSWRLVDSQDRSCRLV